MKLKGVNALEQHVEKLVLVLVSAVFLVVLAMQFLLEPNRVKVGTGPLVAPGRAFDAVESKAQELQARMTQQQLDSVLPAADQLPKYDLVNQLDTRRRTPPVQPRQVAMGPAPEFKGSAGGRVGVSGTEAVASVAVPSVDAVVAANYRVTFDPTEPLNTPELKPLLPAEQPMDKAVASIGARFNGAELKRRLSTANGQAKPIPISWWRDGVEVLSVTLERQELGQDGSWSAAATVPIAPGRYGVAEQLKKVTTPSELSDVVAEAGAIAEDILRPVFYRTIAGREWAPPSKAVHAGATAETPPAVRTLLRQRADATASVERLHRTLEQEGERPAPRQPGAGGGGGGGGGKGGAGGGGGGGAPPPTRDPNQTRQARIEGLQRQIAQAEERIKKIDEELKTLGFDAEGNRVAAEEPTLAEQSPKPLLESESTELWAHDLTVVPGKTYRYRLKVGVNNPMFGRTSALLPEQQPLAASPVVFSEPSEWSAPIDIPADTYYFITNAQEASQIAAARATAEVYQFFYGYYRKAVISVDPGDVIAASIRLPDVNKLPIYDLAALKDGVAPTAPVSAPQPAPDAGKGGGAGGRGALRGPDEGVVLQPGQIGGGEQQRVELPPNAKPYPKQTLDAAIDVMLLDVAKVLSGSGEGRQIAYLRGDQGRILTVLPEEQRKLGIYATVAQSAKDGENQGQVEAPKTEERQVRPPPRQPPRGTPRPPPGTGGGAGGAGGG